MKIDRQSATWTAVNMSLCPADLSLKFRKSTCIAFNSGHPFDSGALGAIDQMLQSLWSRVSKTKVPSHRICLVRSAYSPGVELVSPGVEGCRRRIFKNVFQDKLVVSVDELAYYRVVRSPEVVVVASVVPPPPFLSE